MKVQEACYLCDRPVGEENLKVATTPGRDVHVCAFCAQVDLSSLPVEAIRLGALEMQAEELRRWGVSYAKASVTAQRVIHEAAPAIRKQEREQVLELVALELPLLRVIETYTEGEIKRQVREIFDRLLVLVHPDQSKGERE